MWWCISGADRQTVSRPWRGFSRAVEIEGSEVAPSELMHPCDFLKWFQEGRRWPLQEPLQPCRKEGLGSIPSRHPLYRSRPLAAHEFRWCGSEAYALRRGCGRNGLRRGRPGWNDRRRQRARGDARPIAARAARAAAHSGGPARREVPARCLQRPLCRTDRSQPSRWRPCA